MIFSDQRPFVSTGDFQAAYESLGIVVGVSVLAGNVIKDTREQVRNLTGGQMVHYAALIERSYQQALANLIEKAEKLGADGVICIRSHNVMVAEGAAEVICIGTAIKIMK